LQGQLKGPEVGGVIEGGGAHWKWVVVCKGKGLTLSPWSWGGSGKEQLGGVGGFGGGRAGGGSGRKDAKRKNLEDKPGGP